VVGALAFAVSVQGSPRAGERGKTDGKSGATRLVTGPSAHINDAIAGGAGASMTLQPVAPKTQPPSSYPGGSSIVGQTITLGSVPTRIWFELNTTGWPDAELLKTVQGKVDATDEDMDGGGYSGSAADCAGQPANGASLINAVQPCANSVACRATMSGLAAPCGLGEPDVCSLGFCLFGFQDKCDPEWIGTGVGNVDAADTSTPNFRCGDAVNSAEPSDEFADFLPSYFGTLVVDVPAGAKGTYTIDFNEAESFLHNEGVPPNNNIPIVQFNPGIVKVGCGSCCFGVGGPAPGCIDGQSAAECAALAQPAIFTADGNCQNPPTDDGCCACLTNGDCNDSDACTTDICNNCVCSNPAKATWDQINECCNSATGAETALGCADQCEAASCSEAGNHGSAQCLPRTGQSCNDDNPCTYSDTCASGAGSCAGLDANAVACTSSADCAAATSVGYPCIDGFCNCTLTPDLDIDIVDFGDENCFEDGEKVTANVHVAASSSPVNGGEFFIKYDPTCLDYNSTTLVAPYTNGVYGPVVNEGAGTIFVAVGVEFGAGNGPNGNADMVSFSFTKIGDCNSCKICPLQENPQHTYLTDDAGQRITVQANCSKDIFDESDLELTTPGNIKTNVDCDRPTATEQWAAPSATDECGNATVFCRGEHDSGLVYDSSTVNGGGEFPIGASSFCCYAVSDGPCGTTVGCPPDTTCADADENGKPDGCWTVTVNDETSLDITVGLSPTSQSKPGDNLTRCIKFTLFSNCVQEPLVFSDDVTFGGLFEFVGKSTGKIKIPGSGQWDCITAQDQLHTLRSCYTFDGDEDCVNGQLNASFSGDPLLGGNWLIGGNLDGWKKDDPNADPSLDVIDILDFGTFVSQYLHAYGDTDTPCGTPGPNADINGDGVADLDDYAFISANFLVNSKLCCCGPQTASAIAVTEISVAQLRADGRADLISADLNGDSLLNLADMAAFEQGVRPTTKTPAKGGSRSGSR
jgi:hypothetical protein